ncbi:hypothetical protein BaRGS_00038302, partial [Batillaria attramentaria]
MTDRQRPGHNGDTDGLPGTWIPGCKSALLRLSTAPPASVDTCADLWACAVP